MKNRSLLGAVAAALVFGNGCIEADAGDAAAGSVVFEAAFGGHVFERPIYLTHAGDGSGRIYVMGQLGTIHVLDGPEDDSPELFMDLSSKVHFDKNKNEEGLLGLAFHPRFQDNGELFIYYTPRHGDKDELRRSVISRLRVASGGAVVNSDSEEEILSFQQPFWNHNGGTIVFGPDAMLYAAIGDGGLYGDPNGNAQNTQNLLGSIVRIDVDRKEGGLNYGIPADNPYAGNSAAGRPELWAIGLRNVWRMAFDRQTGELWAADVGQNWWEEVDIIRRGGNYGWNLREGRHPHVPREGAGRVPPGYPPGKTAADYEGMKFDEPAWEYHHDEGKSITGGMVYRGDDAPELQGWYVYADYISGAIYALKQVEALGVSTPLNVRLREKGLPVTSFGEDEAGRAYFMETDGVIYRMTASK